MRKHLIKSNTKTPASKPPWMWLEMQQKSIQTSEMEQFISFNMNIGFISRQLGHCACIINRWRSIDHEKTIQYLALDLNHAQFTTRNLLYHWKCHYKSCHTWPEFTWRH